MFILSDKKERIFVVYQYENKKQVIKLVNNLRTNNIICDFYPDKKSFKAQMRMVNKLGFSLILILGVDEVKTNTIKLKNMVNGKEQVYKQNEIVEIIYKIFNK